MGSAIYTYIYIYIYIYIFDVADAPPGAANPWASQRLFSTFEHEGVPADVHMVRLVHHWMRTDFTLLKNQFKF